MVLSPLNDRYRLSAVNVKMGAEFAAIDDAASIDFLSLGVINPIVYDILTEHAVFGVGRDGNYITNYVFMGIADCSTIYSLRSITAASVEKSMTLLILNIMLILLLLKLSNYYGNIKYK